MPREGPQVFRAGDERFRRVVLHAFNDQHGRLVGIVVPGCDDAERSMTQVERVADIP